VSLAPRPTIGCCERPSWDRRAGLAGVGGWRRGQPFAPRRAFARFFPMTARRPPSRSTIRRGTCGAMSSTRDGNPWSRAAGSRLVYAHDSGLERPDAANRSRSRA